LDGVQNGNTLSAISAMTWSLWLNQNISQ
jgi:hypothetical protein